MTTPEIVLLGDDVVFVAQGSAFVDPGFVADDGNDGIITDQVVVGGGLDTETYGVYTVTYNVTNSGGNAAEEKERTVRVVQYFDDFSDDAGTIATNWDTAAGSWEVQEIDGKEVVSPTDTSGTARIGWDLAGTIDRSQGGAAFGAVIQGGTSTMLQFLDPSQLNQRYEVAYSRAADSVELRVRFWGDGAWQVNTLAEANNVGLTADGWHHAVVALYRQDILVYLDDLSEPILTAQNTRYMSGLFPAVTTWQQGVNVDFAWFVPLALQGEVTLAGEQRQFLDLGDAFSDAGYTAVDGSLADATEQVVVGGDSVDTDSYGTYVISYSLPDPIGNLAVAARRTITIAQHYEDFDRPEADILADWNTGLGAWEVAEFEGRQVLRPTNLGGTVRAIWEAVGERSRNDYDMMVGMIVKGGTNGNLSFYGWDQPNARYDILFDRANNRVILRVHRWEGGTWVSEELGRVDRAGVTNDWHEVAIAVRGSQVAIYLDDLSTPILSAEDTTYGELRVHYSSWQQMANIDKAWLVYQER